MIDLEQLQIYVDEAAERGDGEITLSFDELNAIVGVFNSVDKLLNILVTYQQPESVTKVLLEIVHEIKTNR
jgi:hypothetical protein